MGVVLPGVLSEHASSEVGLNKASSGKF